MTAGERAIRKRKRKSNEQLKILMREFEKNSNWTKDIMLEVAKKTGLSEAQVYKWGWDQKRKSCGGDGTPGGAFPPFGDGCDGGSLFKDEDDEEGFSEDVFSCDEKSSEKIGGGASEKRKSKIFKVL